MDTRLPAMVRLYWFYTGRTRVDSRIGRVYLPWSVSSTSGRR